MCSLFKNLPTKTWLKLYQDFNITWTTWICLWKIWTTWIGLWRSRWACHQLLYFLKKMVKETNKITWQCPYRNFSKGYLLWYVVHVPVRGQQQKEVVFFLFFSFWHTRCQLGIFFSYLCISLNIKMHYNNENFWYVWMHYSKQ